MAAFAMTSPLSKELRLAAQEFVLTLLWVFVSMDAHLSATTCLASCGRQGAMKPCPPPTLNVQVSLATGFAAAVANGLAFRKAEEDRSAENFGGQFNPAVTLALALRGSMPLKRAVVFVVMQLLASLLAALLALVAVGRPCLQDNFHMAMQQTILPAGSRLLLHVLLSMVIIFVPIWAHDRHKSMAVPVLVGFSYIACSLTGLPQLMDVPNLLRTFGIFLIGVRNWSMVWTTALGSLLAAPLVVLLDMLIFREPTNGTMKEEETIYHIVYGIALVDQPKLLHHFVVTGCYEKVAPEMSGQRMPRPKSCVMPVGGFAGWAPGAILWDMPIYAGVPVGKGVGIVAFHVQVHYTDGDVYPGTISKDGIRIYYTPTLRNQTVDSVSTIGIGTHPRMLVPPSKDRYFLTRTCTVVDPCQSADCQGKVWSRPIVSVFYHAHLLGVAMYQSLTRGNTTWDLGSQSRWHYDDQAMFPLMSRNLTVQAGDVIQSTCIFDSQGRTEATPMGLNTWDEMCFTQVNIARPSADPIVGFGCGGPMWEGDLQVTEDAFHVATLHPIDQAENAWQATSYGQATRFLPKNQRDCQQMACRERGEWDDDCCGLKTETSCADGLTKIETNDICWQGFGFTAHYTCCAHAENSSENSFAAGAENGFRGGSWMLLLSVFGLLH